MVWGRSRGKSGRRDSKDKISQPEPAVTPDYTEVIHENDSPARRNNTFAVLSDDTKSKKDKNPIIQNISPMKDFVMDDQNATIKSSEKPLEQKMNFNVDLISEPMETNYANMSTFLLHKHIYDDKSTVQRNITNDDTINQMNTVST